MKYFTPQSSFSKASPRLPSQVPRSEVINWSRHTTGTFPAMRRLWQAGTVPQAN